MLLVVFSSQEKEGKNTAISHMAVNKQLPVVKQQELQIESKGSWMQLEISLFN